MVLAHAIHCVDQEAAVGVDPSVAGPLVQIGVDLDVDASGPRWLRIGVDHFGGLRTWCHIDSGLAGPDVALDVGALDLGYRTDLVLEDTSWSPVDDIRVSQFAPRGPSALDGFLATFDSRTSSIRMDPDGCRRGG